MSGVNVSTAKTKARTHNEKKTEVDAGLTVGLRDQARANLRHALSVR